MQHLVFRNEKIPLGGNLLGERHAGYAYVCHVCGELWGRLEAAKGRTYSVSAWPCENHGNAFNRGGSFLHRVSWLDFSSERNLRKALESCSDEFLRHEAVMAIKQRIEK